MIRQYDRYVHLVRPPGAASGSIFQLVQNQFFPPIIKNVLHQPPLAGANILGNGSTLHISCETWTKREADARYTSTSDLGPLDARYLAASSTSSRPSSPRESSETCSARARSPPRPSWATAPSAGARARATEGIPSSPTATPWAPQSPPSTTASPPGEQRRDRPHRGPHRQQPHGHELRGDAPAPERRRGPANPKCDDDHPRRGRRAAGLLRRRQHRPGAGHHRPGGPDAERHHGGLRPVLHGLHGRHGRLHDSQRLKPVSL